MVGSVCAAGVRETGAIASGGDSVSAVPTRAPSRAVWWSAGVGSRCLSGDLSTGVAGSAGGSTGLAAAAAAELATARRPSLTIRSRCRANRRAAFLGSCHVVPRSLWSIKYVRPVGVVRASQPEGRGPSGFGVGASETSATGEDAVREEEDGDAAGEGENFGSDVEPGDPVPRASSMALTAAAPRRCSASVKRLRGVIVPTIACVLGHTVSANSGAKGNGGKEREAGLEAGKPLDGWCVPARVEAVEEADGNSVWRDRGTGPDGPEAGIGWGGDRVTPSVWTARKTRPETAIFSEPFSSSRVRWTVMSLGQICRKSQSEDSSSPSAGPSPGTRLQTSSRVTSPR